MGIRLLVYSIKTLIFNFNFIFIFFLHHLRAASIKVIRRTQNLFKEIHNEKRTFVIFTEKKWERKWSELFL